MTHRDLSDDELRARLVARFGSRLKAADVDRLVERRDDEDVAAWLDDVVET